MSNIKTKLERHLMLERNGLILANKALEMQIQDLRDEIKRRDNCAFIGAMRDCPTHGESEELKRLRADNAQLQFALEQSEAKFLTTN